ncbi:hypothetical protein ACEWY4_024065 [Coilia grayii]|uniref:Cytoplasmic dynein intermediate chain n=1 Tax=Coilia grayii TaxID=363190 RepID=A0ABD1IZ97_9TELE
MNEQSKQSVLLGMVRARRREERRGEERRGEERGSEEKRGEERRREEGRGEERRGEKRGGERRREEGRGEERRGEKRGGERRREERRGEKRGGERRREERRSEERRSEERRGDERRGEKRGEEKREEERGTGEERKGEERRREERRREERRGEERGSESPVVSVGFARFHPNLLVGGTYSGQIVLWDNRSHRRTPVQRTPLSASAHTHPVYCVNVVGTQNANNLITVSTDGKMCSWSLDMLSQPQESMELVYNKSKPVAVTAMAFPTGDVNNYVVGSEEGTVYTASRHGSKAGICDIFEAHQGPVTGISCHGAVGPVDFSHLFVTSSFDWTVKLWSTKHNKPLYSFEDNADYVYDVMWSPTHPAVFAAVDGMGRLDLWNLNKDTEVPTASVTVEGAPALNRVRWASGGKEVAVGDSEGRVCIYDVGELATPHSEDWARFARTLVEIRANQADAEEEGQAEILS